MKRMKSKFALSIISRTSASLGENPKKKVSLIVCRKIKTAKISSKVPRKMFFKFYIVFKKK